MEQTFITGLDIHKVRHLENISIPLSEDSCKNLLLTGKNGSGKTSVLESLKDFLEYVISDRFDIESNTVNNIRMSEASLKKYENQDSTDTIRRIEQMKKHKSLLQQQLLNWTDGVTFVCDYAVLREKYNTGNFILAYYEAERISKVEISSTIEKIPLKEKYSIKETPGVKLIKYMVAKKATQAFAAQQEDTQQRVEEIESWFDSFERILKSVFNDQGLKLKFNIETFEFSIHQTGHEPFDFNQMSSGYSAVFDIINDLLMRMEGKEGMVEGIVLIDEIETHLHLELQKNILPILTELFPNIQFIVTTHSPFVLSSIENAVIYDLETHTLVPDGMQYMPYESIVESYFATNRLSKECQEKLNRYEALTTKPVLNDNDYAEIMELEIALDEIPDFLSPDIASKYSRLKQEFNSREA